MDSLPLGKHVIFVPIILCALHLVRSQPFRRFPGTNGFFPMVPGFTAPAYQPLVAFQGQAYNTWNGGPAYLNMAPVGRVQNPVAVNHFLNNFGQHLQNVRANNQPAIQSRWPSFRTYNSPVQNNNFIPLNTRPPPLTPKKISVVSGPLSKVIPHPKRRNLKAKRRLRYRLVAKAKSFPGILKDTSLDVTKLRP